MDEIGDIRQYWEDVRGVWGYEIYNCVVCGKDYKEIDNIGRWKCIKLIQRFGKDRKSQPTEFVHVKADHRIEFREYQPSDDLSLPNSLDRDFLGNPNLYKQALVISDEQMAVAIRNLENEAHFSLTPHSIIRRYDWRAEEQFYVNGYNRWGGLGRMATGVLGGNGIVPIIYLNAKTEVPLYDS